MMRLDPVTHCRALLLPPRPPLGANARAACAPSVLSLFSEHPKAVDAIPVPEGSVETAMAVQTSHRRLLPATRDDAEPLALLRKHRRKPQKSMPSTDPEPRGPRAAIRLVPSRNMPLGRTSIPEFPDSKPPDPPSQHIEMSACFPSSSHRGRTHAVQTRGARDKILPVLRSCGRYVVGLYNSHRPHSSLDGRTPDQAYFNSLPFRAAA